MDDDRQRAARRLADAEHLGAVLRRIDLSALVRLSDGSTWLGPAAQRCHEALRRDTTLLAHAVDRCHFEIGRRRAELDRLASAAATQPAARRQS